MSDRWTTSGPEKRIIMAGDAIAMTSNQRLAAFGARFTIGMAFLLDLAKHTAEGL